MDDASSSAAEIPLPQFHSPKSKLDEVFFKWLAMSDTQGLIRGIVRDVKAGKPIHIPTTLLSASARPGGFLQSPRRMQNGPPLSPSKKATAPDGSGSPKHFTFDDGGSSSLQSPKQHGAAEARPTEATAAAVGKAAGAAARSGSGSSPVRPRNTAGSKIPSERIPVAAGSEAQFGGKTGDEPSTPVRSSGPSSSLPHASPAESAKRTAQTPSGFASSVPGFFVPGEGGRGKGKPLEGQHLDQKLDAILEVWRRGAGKEGQAPASDARVTVAGVKLAASDARLGLPVEQFAAVAKTLCGFPSFFAAPLFRRISVAFGRCRFADGEAGIAGGAAPAGYPLPRQPTHRPVVLSADEGAPAAGEGALRETAGEVQLYQFLRFWRSEIEPYDHYDRFLRLVSQRGAAVLPTKRKLAYRALVPTDFMPLLEELLAFHPGLAFLENTPEFQEKYARTVIGRIFFKLDPTARQCINSRALRQSDLLHAFHTVDMEEDINLVNEYFSYEHFYVLYCKFWELDADHDFFLSREDLSKLTDLTQVALDRVFEQAGRPFTSDQKDRMAYEDFIAFLMSEEDKTAPEAIRYWFGVVDLDGDGVLSPQDMRVFYAEQHARMQELGMEAVSFGDLMTQMTDLLKPDVPAHFELKDFLNPTRVKLTGVLFSCLFNISKFQAFEARDAVLVKQQLNSEGISQWDRFASVEYMRLAEEEEGGIEDNMSFEVDGSGDGRW